MQHEEASRTALLITASLILLHHDAKYSRLVSKTSAALCARVLEKHSWQTRLFSKIVRQTWFRPIAKLMQRITIPGILLQYALRKKCIRALVRSALANGVAKSSYSAQASIRSVSNYRRSSQLRYFGKSI